MPARFRLRSDKSKPVDGAFVTVGGSNGSAGPDGRVSLTVGSGSQSVTVAKDGYDSSMATVNVATNGTVSIDVGLKPTAVIAIGTVSVLAYEANPTNAAVIKGAAKGYVDAGYAIGAYGTTAIWQGIVGDLTFGIPEWRAAGQTSQAEALARCGPDRAIQGGDSVISQWVEDGRDRNVTCPGTSSQMFRWFTQY